MSVPVQVVLDVPADIAIGIANGTLVRVGSVVRDGAGHIVKHLSEAGPRPDGDLVRVGEVARSLSRSKLGKTIVVGGVLLVGLFAVKSWKRRRCLDSLNASLYSYLSAVQEGELTVKQIDDLSDNIEQVKKISPKTSVLIAEQIIDLVEEFTLRLANANSLVWEPIQEGDIESIDRMCRSLDAQRQIFGTAA
ncbi:hypothetical protein [Actinomyces sp. SKVG-SVH-4(1)]|jgi:hypothetical protein|uniref:hypothetical protein n=1 Tax=Actinomyces sp. SKVG-SVH-4(1) TaxID=3240382 RepID=UPI003AF232EE